MKWNNLKHNQCPQCGQELPDHYDYLKKMFECPCGFKITIERMAQIVRSQLAEEMNKDYGKR